MTLTHHFVNVTTNANTSTLSLHDALPISDGRIVLENLFEELTFYPRHTNELTVIRNSIMGGIDRKSTRLNSSHRCISYAVFCLKKKNECPRRPPPRRLVGRRRRCGYPRSP